MKSWDEIILSYLASGFRENYFNLISKKGNDIEFADEMACMELYFNKFYHVPEKRDRPQYDYGFIPFPVEKIKK